MDSRSRRKPIRKRLLTLMITLVLFSSVPLSVFATNEDAIIIGDVSVTIDGEKVHLDDPVRMLEGRLFLPVAPLASMFGATVEWDQKNQAMTIHTDTADKIVMSNGVPVVYFNDTRYKMDVSPFIEDGRTYIPIRYAAGLMGAAVTWHADDKLAQFTAVDSAEERTASMMTVAEPFTEEELLLLAKIVQVESGYESYEGQLAVANVILNRVKDPRFPNTIHDVIYSGKQFPPAHNGLLDKSEPNDSVLRAAKDALNGKNNVSNAVYFFNPDVTSGPFWNRLDVVAAFGNHSFAK
jgi:N-acetylmuramoyl-L-alanine amidase